jgi:trehalose 6-phosphate synthase
VLSENAGAHEQLSEWALTVNPFDVAGQAEAMRVALEMSGDERRERLDGLRAHVRAHDLAEWVESQLADLDRARASHASARS